MSEVVAWGRKVSLCERCKCLLCCFVHLKLIYKEKYNIYSWKFRKGKKFYLKITVLYPIATIILIIPF